MKILKFKKFVFFKTDDGRRKYLKQPPKIYKKETHGISLEKIDHHAFLIVKKLQDKGFQAYIVGGSVRDLLTGRNPKDFDIVTNARPHTIKALFHRANIIGRRFRIVHIMFGKKIFETATFRSIPNREIDEELLITRDNTYGSESEDSARRDFTINALFYNPVTEEIIDYVNGYRDIKKKLISIIGRPEVSYCEDPVRMIRAVKYKAITGFDMEKSAYKEISKLAKNITSCSPARLLEEIFKIMRSGVSLEIFHSLVQTKLLKYMMPEVYKKLYPHSQKIHRFESSPLGRRLKVMDELIDRGRKISNVVFLGILFYDLVREEVENSTHHDKGYISNIYLTKASQRLKFSKKAKDQLVKVLIMQSRFLKYNLTKKKSPAIDKLVMRDYFKDGLDFFEIFCRIEKKWSDQLLFWKDIYKNNKNKIFDKRNKRINIKKLRSTYKKKKS